MPKATVATTISPSSLLEAGFDLAAVVGLHPAVIMKQAWNGRPRAAPGPAFRSWRGCRNRRCPTGPCGRRQSAGSGRAGNPWRQRPGGCSAGQIRAGRSRAGLAIEQARDDFAAGFLVRGGGKGGQRHVQRAAQLTDAQVVGAEVVAPLADAMRLVHRNQGDADPPQAAASVAAEASRSGAMYKSFSRPSSSAANTSSVPRHRYCPMSGRRPRPPLRAARAPGRASARSRAR
jgi:hypothetical protein